MSLLAPYSLASDQWFGSSVSVKLLPFSFTNLLWLCVTVQDAMLDRSSSTTYIVIFLVQLATFSIRLVLK
jgi:hypothetical protein